MVSGLSDTRKNVLLISFDDCISYWRYKDVFGEVLQTPNLDRICATSTAFRSAYCQAPICGPSRASLMSGKMPHESGVFDNSVDVFDRVAPEQMWPFRLKESGCFCSSGGKVHHRYKPLRRPYHRVLYSDERKAFKSDMHMPPEITGKKRFGGNRGGWGTTDEKDDVTYYDYQSATSAIDFLESYEADAPFYREVGFYSPHGPHYTPVRFKEMYNARNFRRPEAWAGGYSKNPLAEDHFPANVDPDDRKWWQDSVRNYFSALSHGDYHLGRVWDALKASPHADNTVVVLMSDHGFHLGNLDRYKKTTLWEQVAGVPVIVHDPTRPEPQVIDDPVALMDVGPTVLDYAGVGPPEGGFGRSLRPLVEGGSDPDRAIPIFLHDNASIRKGDYRIIRYEDGSTQLYDLRTDFWQLHDLGPDHPAHAEMLAELVACCRACGFDVPGA